MRYAWIDKHRGEHDVPMLCRLLGVCKSGYLAWRRRGRSQRSEQDEKLLVHIRAITAANDNNYGSPRVTRALREQGFTIGENRVARLMAQAGIRAKHKKKFRVTTDSKHKLPVAPNLLEQRFDVAKPNEVWLADVTYIWTLEGWAYLAAVLDLCTRRVVGWKLSGHNDAELVQAALLAAIWRHKPARGLIHHSDRGSNYCAQGYRDTQALHGIVGSMSRRGNCYDNAPMESFFKTLKVERIYGQRYQTRQALQADLFEYIELYYNAQRKHSSLGYVSPIQFERRINAGKSA